MRVALYARTSEDEQRQQDCRAQLDQVREDAAAAGVDVVAEHMDDGVSGGVPPRERPGFGACLDLVLAGGCDAIWTRDASRLGRQHPFLAGADWLQLVDQGVEVVFTRGRQLPHKPAEEWDLADCLMAAVELSGHYGYRYSVRENTRHAMADLKAGRRQTRSGKSVGRPRKVSDDELRLAYDRACETDPAEAARWLSQRRGVDDVVDERSRRKRRVARTTLLTGWQRLGLGWPPRVENGGASETVSD